MESKWVKYSIEENILYANYEEDIVVDFQEAQDMVKERLAFQKGADYPIVIKLNGLKTSSKKARTFMAKEGIKGISAGAFVVNSSVEKVVFNFFLSIEKPKIPTRAFTESDEAVRWIKEVIK